MATFHDHLIINHRLMGLFNLNRHVVWAFLPTIAKRNPISHQVGKLEYTCTKHQMPSEKGGQECPPYTAFFEQISGLECSPYKALRIINHWLVDLFNLNRHVGWAFLPTIAKRNPISHPVGKLAFACTKHQMPSEIGGQECPPYGNGILLLAGEA